MEKPQQKGWRFDVIFVFGNHDGHITVKPLKQSFHSC